MQIGHDGPLLLERVRLVAAVPTELSSPPLPLPVLVDDARRHTHYPHIFHPAILLHSLDRDFGPLHFVSFDLCALVRSGNFQPLFPLV